MSSLVEISKGAGRRVLRGAIRTGAGAGILAAPIATGMLGQKIGQTAAKTAARSQLGRRRFDELMNTAAEDLADDAARTEKARLAGEISSVGGAGAALGMISGGPTALAINALKNKALQATAPRRAVAAPKSVAESLAVDSAKLSPAQRRRLALLTGTGAAAATGLGVAAGASGVGTRGLKTD